MPSTFPPTTAPPAPQATPQITEPAPAEKPACPLPLPLPLGVAGHRLVWPYVITFIFFHLAALAACFPYFFSWTGAVTAYIGLYVFGTLGINLCYHRLLTHRGLQCPAWLEHTFAILGVCCLQDTPARWVAIHRMHHQHSDEQPDPHSPLVTLFWGHMGWLLVENKEVNCLSTYERYARDVLRDPFYFKLERRLTWVWINVIQGVLFAAAGFVLGYVIDDTIAGGIQMALSLLVWGVFLRTVLVWHITWSVNSLAHVFGYRSYRTGEGSRNNWFVALISNGEGWHNNHHADQRSASHGHRWWEIDITYLTIRALAAVGLAKEVMKPSDRLADKTS